MIQSSRVVQATLLSLLLVACSGVEMKPGDKARNAREIREGPGVLTGSDGEFVIFRVDEKKTAAEKSGREDPVDPDAAGKDEKKPEAVE